ncbi:hypothetical protein FACS189444_1200 [Spirochaetia bacterium]|nr:hypothetical protein FACS189444_1200 [Spirochaetia bacterium]
MKRFVILGVCVMLVMLMGSVMMGQGMFGVSMMALSDAEFSESENIERAAVRFDLPSDRNWAGPVPIIESSGGNGE